MEITTRCYLASVTINFSSKLAFIINDIQTLAQITKAAVDVDLG